MRIEDLSVGNSLVGIEPSAVVSVAAVIPITEDSVTLIYKTPDGALKERLLNRADEENIVLATQERPLQISYQLWQY